MADALADAEPVVLGDLKHSVLVEAPERVARHLRDFVLRHRGEGLRWTPIAGRLGGIF